MFHFCIADSEHDWREGSEQYKFIEKCLASADRQKQPWLIFIAHRVLGYSSSYWQSASFGEPMGRESLQKLWQKHKVDIAFFGHVHNYERTCPIYQVWIHSWKHLIVFLPSPQKHNFITKLAYEFNAAPMRQYRKISLFRRCEWNNPHCGWWGRKSLSRFWPYTA